MKNQTITQIAEAIHANAREKGFHFDESELSFVASQMNNVTGEVSELWESYRRGTQDSFCDKAEKMIQMGLRPLSCKEEELADIIIRVLDISKRIGVDIAEAVEIKHLYNTTRPFKHGKLN